MVEGEDKRVSVDAAPGGNSSVKAKVSSILRLWRSLPSNPKRSCCGAGAERDVLSSHSSSCLIHHRVLEGRRKAIEDGTKIRVAECEDARRKVSSVGKGGQIELEVDSTDSSHPYLLS